MQFRATQIVTPEDEHSSHFFWTYSHNFNIENQDFTRMLAARIAEGFEEDRLMIEAQQEEVNRSEGDEMAFILADNGLALGRRIIDERIASDAPTPKTHNRGQGHRTKRACRAQSFSRTPPEI